ncbi:MAG: helix-turn-helix domain-containing protein [Prevotella sp.]|nr:helix-turn-helix domain-containing protein [Prevotella sp.]
MKHFELVRNQAYLSFNDEDVIIIDKIENLPENSVYQSEYVLVLICTAGKIQIEYDGNTITIHQGEIFLGVPGSMLSDYMISPSFDCKLLAIKPTEATVSRALHTQIINSTLYIKSHPVAQLSASDTEAIFNYYNLICNQIKQSQHRYKNGEVRALLNAFLLKVVGIMDCENNTAESDTTLRGEQLVEKFVWMVNEDCGRNRLVEYYAEKLHITPKYLSTLVRATLGHTPTDIIKVVTIKEIERQLRYTSDSIKQISAAMNFPNTSFFGKYFKHNTGITPNSYRKKYCK